MKNSKGMIILLVALAALTLVVVVGLFFFYPKEQPKVATTAPAPTTGTSAAPTTPGTPLPDTFDPVEWTRDPKTSNLPTTPAPNSGAQGDQGGFTVSLPNEPKGSATTPGLPATPGVTFPGDTAPAKPNAVTTTPVNATTTPKAAPAKPAVKPEVTTTKSSKPVEKPAKVGDYWIQVGSFKDRYQAENTAKSLEAEGLKGTLTTATVNGATVIRVRVGPYTNAAEAGKFLAWLKPVKEFAASYITKAPGSH